MTSGREAASSPWEVDDIRQEVDDIRVGGRELPWVVHDIG